MSSTSAPGAISPATWARSRSARKDPTALMRLPAIMEDMLDAWDKAKNRPQFKAEYIVTHAITSSLAEGAQGKRSANEDEQGRDRSAGATNSSATRASCPVRM